VKAKKSVAPKVDLRPARLRVMAKRDGALRPASVRLFAAGSDLSRDPLVTQPTNQKFTVAAGHYDAMVELNEGTPHPLMRLRGIKADSMKLIEVSAEFQDGKIKVSASENGRSASGLVRVFVPNATVDFAQGTTAQPIEVPPGRYIVQTTLESAADLANRRREVWVDAGKQVAVAETFDTGTLTVSASRDNKAHEAIVRVALPGAADFFTYFTAPGSAVLSPGKYDVLIEPGGSDKLRSEKRRNVEVQKKKDKRILFDLSPAMLSVKVQREKKTVEALEIVVREAGGGSEASKPEADGTWRLWPGRYEIAVKLGDGTQLTDGPFELGYGEKASRLVEFTSGTLTVVPVRGKTVASEAEVFVYKPGASAPTTKARAQAVIELAPGVYDIKVVAGADSRWQEGVRIKEGKNAPLKIELSSKQDSGVALPEGDLPQGDEPPEGDAPTPKKPSK
jgi:hypothetical protein